MKDKIRFYRCPHCGNIITKVEDSGVPVICCGEKMQELIPNDKDATVEKHVPFVEIQDGKLIVKVGEVEHPMSEDHYIMWIALVSDKSLDIHFLKPMEKPITSFPIVDDYVIYEYCNFHGLWKKES